MPVLSDHGNAVVGSRKAETIYVNNLHKILDHCGKVSTRLKGKAFGYEVMGMFETYKARSVGNVRLKNVNKEWKGGSTTPGEQLYVDISSIKGKHKNGTTPTSLAHEEFIMASEQGMSPAICVEMFGMENVIDDTTEFSLLPFLEDLGLKTRINLATVKNLITTKQDQKCPAVSNKPSPPMEHIYLRTKLNFKRLHHTA
jgi:hypothetical protein